MKIIRDHNQLRKSFSQEGYSTWPDLESEGFVHGNALFLVSVSFIVLDWFSL